MSAVLACLALAAVAAALVIHDVKPWRRPTLTVTITADVSGFHRAMTQAAATLPTVSQFERSMAEVAKVMTFTTDDAKALGDRLRLFADRSRHVPDCRYCTNERICDRCDGTGTYNAGPVGWFVCACSIDDDGAWRIA